MALIKEIKGDRGRWEREIYDREDEVTGWDKAKYWNEKPEEGDVFEGESQNEDESLHSGVAKILADSVFKVMGKLFGNDKNIEREEEK